MKRVYLDSNLDRLFMFLDQWKRCNKRLMNLSTSRTNGTGQVIGISNEG